VSVALQHVKAACMRQAEALLELTRALIAAPGPVTRIAASGESTESAEVSCCPLILAQS
jgi:hypothetical protein